MCKSYAEYFIVLMFTTILRFYSDDVQLTYLFYIAIVF